MKKIIYILFTIELLIVSLLGLSVVKDNEINNMLYNDTTSISIVFKDYKKLNKNYSDWIKEIVDKNGVIISKYIFNNNEKLSVYTTDTNLNNKVRLKSGSLPKRNSNEFISNKNTSNSNQVGKFSTLNEDTSILIRDFGKISEVGEGGLFYISTQNEDTINNILKELNGDGSILVAKIHDRYTDSNLYLNPLIIRDLILTTLCFLATIVHYSVSKSREASILRLNGYSKLDIIIKVIKNIFRIMSLSSLTAFLIYIIYTFKINMGIKPAVYFIIFSSICILINIFISILIVSFNNRNSKYILSLKGKKSYRFVNIIHFMLKFVFVLFLILSINGCISNYNMLQTQLSNLSEWDKAKDVYNLTLKDTGEQSLSKEEVIRNSKIKKFYKNLEDEREAFLIDTTNFEILSNGSYMYEVNSKGKNPDISQYGKNIKINKNYLKINPIYSNGKEILNLIKYDDKTINLLVPKKLQKYENEIKKEFRELFYFEKIEVENMYNEELGMALNRTRKSDLGVNIIYVDNNQSYFTYNSFVMDDNRNLIDDPIAIVDANNIDDSFYLSYISRCVYFKSKKLDALADIGYIIKNQDVEDSIKSLHAVYNEYGLEIDKLKKSLSSEIFTIIIIAISNLMITYNIVVSYYERNKYKLYIKKLFGYSAIYRSISLIISLVLINIIPISIASMMTNLNSNIILYGILILAVEIVMAIILDKIISNSSFNKIIKGEH
ncbi:bacteriocin-associated integral membrane family protein [Clostridioides difficile]